MAPGGSRPGNGRSCVSRPRPSIGSASARTRRCTPAGGWACPTITSTGAEPMLRRPFLGCLLAGPATLRAQVLVAHRVGILDDRPQRLSKMVMRAFMQVLASQGHRVELL